MNSKPFFLPFDAILVPQGPEYRAVCRGLNRTNQVRPLVFSIPLGSESLTRYLNDWQTKSHFPPKVLLIGLCGSLLPQRQPGNVVLYQSCVYVYPPKQLRHCDVHLTSLLHYRLPNADLVIGLTSDRFIWSSAEKREVGQRYQADVVDMEGFAALNVLQAAGIEVAMVRVVSDGYYHDLPDLNRAIDAHGSLHPLPLALGLLKQPIAAARLIRGSLTGLTRLRQITTELFAR